jgi:hypothetical protein
MGGGGWREGSVAVVKLPLWRWPRWGDGWRFGGPADAGQVGAYGAGVGQRCDPPHARAASRALLRVSQKHAGQQLSPGEPEPVWRGSCRVVSRALDRLGGGRHDEDPVGGMRCQHAVVAYQVQAGSARMRRRRCPARGPRAWIFRTARRMESPENHPG